MDRHTSLLNTLKQASRSDKRGGMKPLYAHDSVQEVPPSLFWEAFTSGCALLPLRTRGWKLARGTWNEETSESCSRLTRNDGARMRGETVRRTRHFYAHEGKNWPRAWPNRCWQPSSELKICCRLLLTIRRMELFTSWVTRIWMTCAFVTFYAQVKTLAAQSWGGSFFLSCPVFLLIQ